MTQFTTHLSSGSYDFLIPLAAEAALTGTILNHTSGSHAIFLPLAVYSQGIQYLLKPSVPSGVWMYVLGLLKKVSVYEEGGRG